MELFTYWEILAIVWEIWWHYEIRTAFSHCNAIISIFFSIFIRPDELELVITADNYFRAFIILFSIS